MDSAKKKHGALKIHLETRQIFYVEGVNYGLPQNVSVLWKRMLPFEASVMAVVCACVCKIIAAWAGHMQVQIENMTPVLWWFSVGSGVCVEPWMQPVNAGVETHGEGRRVIRYKYATVGEPLNTGSSPHARASHPEPEHFYTACYYSISSVFVLSKTYHSVQSADEMQIWRKGWLISKTENPKNPKKLNPPHIFTLTNLKKNSGRKKRKMNRVFHNSRPLIFTLIIS